MSKHSKHCEFPSFKKKKKRRGVLGLRGRNPNLPPSKDTIFNEIHRNGTLSFWKRKRQSEGFPDYFSVKINYNCWVPLQFWGTSGIFPLFFFSVKAHRDLFFYFSVLLKNSKSGLQQAKLRNSQPEANTKKCACYRKKVKQKNTSIIHKELILISKYYRRITALNTIRAPVWCHSLVTRENWQAQNLLPCAPKHETAF